MSRDWSAETPQRSRRRGTLSALAAWSGGALGSIPGRPELLRPEGSRFGRPRLRFRIALLFQKARILVEHFGEMRERPHSDILISVDRQAIVSVRRILPFQPSLQSRHMVKRHG